MTHDPSEDTLRARRESWQYRGQQRPSFAVAPGPAQESVWDYPRPPQLERAARPVRVELGERVVARSTRAWRVCETAGAPVYYVPMDDVEAACLEPSATRSFCEWKGEARYYDLVAGGRRARDAAFRYPEPEPAFAPLADALGFYPGRVDACYLGDERVRPQPGGFYAGWVTAEIKGPMKGEPGTEGW